jgi:competence protein ComEA
VVVAVIVALAAAVVAGLLSPRGGAVEIAGGRSTADATAPPPLVVVVHVLGAVRAPGLYVLPEGSRIVDAIAVAGGFADDADRGGVNLARILADAEQVRVPVIGEVAPGGVAPGVASDGRVNLNTADSAALDTLPRVGPAMAQRIIAYRDEHGGFRSIEDLREVSGIGDKTFDSLKDLVTL